MVYSFHWDVISSAELFWHLKSPKSTENFEPWITSLDKIAPFEWNDIYHAYSWFVIVAHEYPKNKASVGNERVERFTRLAKGEIGSSTVHWFKMRKKCDTFRGKSKQMSNFVKCKMKRKYWVDVVSEDSVLVRVTKWNKMGLIKQQFTKTSSWWRYSFWV